MFGHDGYGSSHLEKVRKASKSIKQPRLFRKALIAYHRTRSFDVIPAVGSILGLSTLNPAVA